MKYGETSELLCNPIYSLKKVRVIKIMMMMMTITIMMMTLIIMIKNLHS